MSSTRRLAREPIDDRGSFAWLAFPDERFQRSSSAVVVEGGCLLVDPLDAPGLEHELERIGPVVGVVTLLDRHQRDAAALASRHGAPRLLPRALGGRGVGIQGIEERTVVERRRWREALLWLPDRRLLVCAETLGTNPFFLARPADRLGVHPVARLFRVARAFGGLEPGTIAVGHGLPLRADATAAMRTALARSRRDLPRAWARAASLAVRGRA